MPKLNAVEKLREITNPPWVEGREMTPPAIDLFNLMRAILHSQIYPTKSETADKLFKKEIREPLQPDGPPSPDCSPRPGISNLENSNVPLMKVCEVSQKELLHTSSIVSCRFYAHVFCERCILRL